ncbi:MAG TPA: TPM domain-containing protein [Luteibacter sp.]|nr:TPM domain-containing protein [Luteibacter sp.]
MPRFAAGLLLAIALLAPPLAALAADAVVPKLTRHVTDLTGTLTAEQVNQLDSRLVDLEKTKGSQVVVLMVPTTQPEDLEGYSLKVAETNKVGREGPDDGVLLLLAKDDRRVRIEVGYGLEGALPDAIASRIIREYMAPKLRANDYYGGINEALNAITQIVQGEALPAPVAPDESHEKRRGGGGHLLLPLIFGAIFLRGILGRAPLGVRMPLGGVVAGGLGWLFLQSIFGGVIGLIAGAALMAIPLGAGRSIGGGGWGGFGGWGGGGGFGGGGFGGGGGGGFSGGGGSFGGGGASGSW